MACSNSYLEYVMEQLEPLGNVRSRKMFGGVGIYCGDLFFALIGSGVLYFKVDDSNRGDFEQAGMGPFKPFPDKDEVMQYYEVPPDVLEDRNEIILWANKALDVAGRAAKKKKPKKKKQV